MRSRRQPKEHMVNMMNADSATFCYITRFAARMQEGIPFGLPK